MEKYIRKLIFVFAFVFPLFVFGIDDVKAADCEYGITCMYEFCGRRDSTQAGSSLAKSCPTNSGDVVVSVAFRCSDTGESAGTCSSFVSWATASKNNGESYEEIEWGNYNDAFNNVDSYKLSANPGDTLKAKFNNSKKFSCPAIYPSLSNGYSDNTYSFSFQSGTKRVAAKKQTCINKEQSNDDVNNTMREETNQQASDTSMDNIEETIENAKGNNEASSCDENCRNAIKNWANQEGYLNVSNVGDPCSIISDTLGEFLKNVFFFISVAGIVLVVCLTALGFVKAIVASDDDGLMKAFKQLKTRIIVVIVLLILPVILSFIIDVINDNSEGEVKIGADGNVFCDVTKG